MSNEVANKNQIIFKRRFFYLIMCKLCETKTVYEFTNKRKLCKNCFIRWFQKKFLYTLRKFQMIKNGDIISYKDRGDFREIVLEELLKKFFENGNVRLIKNKGFGKIALADSSDIVSYKILHRLIEEKINSKEILPVEGKIIRPLYLFLDKEILLYARLRKLKFKKIPEKKSKISTFVDEMEKKHPEVKHSVVRSCLEIYG